MAGSQSILNVRPAAFSAAKDAALQQGVGEEAAVSTAKVAANRPIGIARIQLAAEAAVRAETARVTCCHRRDQNDSCCINSSSADKRPTCTKPIINDIR